MIWFTSYRFLKSLKRNWHSLLHVHQVQVDKMWTNAIQRLNWDSNQIRLFGSPRIFEEHSNKSGQHESTKKESLLFHVKNTEHKKKTCAVVYIDFETVLKKQKRCWLDIRANVNWNSKRFRKTNENDTKEPSKKSRDSQENLQTYPSIKYNPSCQSVNQSKVSGNFSLSYKRGKATFIWCFLSETNRIWFFFLLEID